MSSMNARAWFVIAALVVVVGLVALVVAQRSASEVPGSAAEPPDQGDELAEPQAETAARGTLPRLVDLGADKCVPCKMMAPILDELAETYEGRLEVEFIDVWKDRTAGREYGVKVIPTQIFYAPDGTELFRHQGFLSREDILAKWAELGYDLGPVKSGE